MDRGLFPTSGTDPFDDDTRSPCFRVLQQPTRSSCGRLSWTASRYLTSLLSCFSHVCLSLPSFSLHSSPALSLSPPSLHLKPQSGQPPTLSRILGGNSSTFIVADVSPPALLYLGSLSTPLFSQKKKVVNIKTIVSKDDQGNVNKLQARIQ
ncbi:MAG: hypothetical protein J3Q66DRAFT_156085 [Benniella sp.]|nr:MAG: hypothetical protein J3Q66DRAFT_156085 [Benniella sp.]